MLQPRLGVVFVGTNLYGKNTNEAIEVSDLDEIDTIYEAAEEVLTRKAEEVCPYGAPLYPFVIESLQVLNQVESRWEPALSHRVHDGCQLWAYQPPSKWHSDLSCALPSPFPATDPDAWQALHRIFFSLSRGADRLDTDTLASACRRASISPQCLGESVWASHPPGGCLTFLEWYQLASAHPFFISRLDFSPREKAAGREERRKRRAAKQREAAWEETRQASVLAPPEARCVTADAWEEEKGGGPSLEEVRSRRKQQEMAMKLSRREESGDDAGGLGAAVRSARERRVKSTAGFADPSPASKTEDDALAARLKEVQCRRQEEQLEEQEEHLPSNPPPSAASTVTEVLREEDFVSVTSHATSLPQVSVCDDPFDRVLREARERRKEEEAALTSLVSRRNEVAAVLASEAAAIAQQLEESQRHGSPESSSRAPDVSPDLDALEEALLAARKRREQLASQMYPAKDGKVAADKLG